LVILFRNWIPTLGKWFVYDLFIACETSLVIFCNFILVYWCPLLRTPHLESCPFSIIASKTFLNGCDVNLAWNSNLTHGLRHYCVIDQSTTENKVIHTLIIDFFSHGLRSANWSIRQWRHRTSIWESEKRPYILLN
jgi:hypothetical protein